MEQADTDFRALAALFNHTVWVAFPLPTPQGRWDLTLRDMPEIELRVLRLATLGTRGNLGIPIQEGVPWLQRDPKAKLPRPTLSTFLGDCHLPAMIRLTGGYAR